MKLMNKSIEKKLLAHPFGSTEGKGEEAEVLVKYFGGSAATWLVTEGEKEDGEWVFFGKVTLDGQFWEWGYFLLSDLTGVKFPPFGLGVERDLYFSGTVAEAVR